MANLITGTILRIDPTKPITTKDGSRTFYRRTIVLDTTRIDPNTGERGYNNIAKIDFGGDKCALLDQYQVGQRISIAFDLQGTEYTNAAGVKNIYMTVMGYNIFGANTQAQPQPQYGAPTQEPMTSIYDQQPSPQPQGQPKGYGNATVYPKANETTVPYEPQVNRPQQPLEDDEETDLPF